MKQTQRNAPPARKLIPAAVLATVENLSGSRIAEPTGQRPPSVARVGVMPENGFLRLSQIVGDRKAKPPVPGIIPVGVSTWWAGVKAGRFPKPCKLGPRTTAWRVEDIRELLSQSDICKAA